jgi:hypothetical protein
VASCRWYGTPLLAGKMKITMGVLQYEAQMAKMVYTTERSGLTGNPSPVLPDGEGGFTPCPLLLTEEEVIRLLRIPEVSSAADRRNVIENLKRARGLPRIHLCGKALYPLQAVGRWICENTVDGK